MMFGSVESFIYILLVAISVWVFLSITIWFVILPMIGWLIEKYDQITYRKKEGVDEHDKPTK